MLSRFQEFLGNAESLRGQLVRGWAGSGLVQVSNRFLSLLLGVVLARALGVEGYGVYAYVLALLTLLQVVGELGMPALLTREVAASESHQDWSHLRGIFVRSIQIALAVALTLAVILAFWLLQKRGDMPISQIKTFSWGIVLLPLLVITSLMAATLRGLRHVVKAQIIQLVIRPILVLIGIGMLFIIHTDQQQPENAMFVQVCSVLVVLFVTIFMLYRYIPRPAHTTTAEYHTRLWVSSALSLTVIGGAGIINNQTDILMLGYMRTSQEVGIYRVAVLGSVLVTFGLQAANAVLAPHFARLYALGDLERLQSLVTLSARAILLAASPVALVLIIFGGTITGWAFGAGFEESHAPLAILAAGRLIGATIGSVGFLLNMTGHERDVARVLLMTAGLNILLNFVLIPPFGMLGAASATAISYVLWKVLLYRIVKLRIGIDSLVFTSR